MTELHPKLLFYKKQGVAVNLTVEGRFHPDPSAVSVPGGDADKCCLIYLPC